VSAARHHRNFTAEQLQVRLAAIDTAFGPNQRAEKPVKALEQATPAPGAPRTPVRLPGQAEPLEQPSRGTRWDAKQLQDRAKGICLSWARISGRDVALADAAKVARLSLPLPAVTKVLHETWRRRTGIGLAWPALRAAEVEFLAYEAARRTRS
jgi:hypothetical protein